MRKLLAVLLAFIFRTTSCTTTAPTTATYCITFSRHVRAGQPLIISADILNPRESIPVAISFDLVGEDDDVLLNGPVVSVYNSTIVEFNFPENFEIPPSEETTYIRASGSGGTAFTRYARVTPLFKTRSVFIQTDRAVYRPGDTVRIRALVTQLDLKVLKEPMDVVVLDPKGNRIQQWIDVSGDDTAGVIQLEMMTSLYPPLGKWTILAKSKGLTEEKTFTLEEYELPRFEVEFVWPKFALTSATTVNGSVTATYTFGAPVQGIVTLTIKYSAFGFMPLSRLQKTYTLDENGSADLKVTLEELENLIITSGKEWWHYHTYVCLPCSEVEVVAEVKDAVTDDVMKAKATMKFYEDPIRFSFDTSQVSICHKPGLDYTTQVRVTQGDGSRLRKDQTETITFHVFYQTGDFFGQREKILSQEVTTDENGIASLTFRTPSESLLIWIQAVSRTLDDDTWMTTHPAYSPSGQFLQITPATTAPTVGKEATFDTEATEAPPSLTYQIFAKGVLVTAGHVMNMERKRRLFFKVKITTIMAPSAELFVFYKREQDGEIITDSIIFSADNIFGNKLSLRYTEEEVKPGENTRLEVSGEPDSLVFMLGVDKSVRLLGTGNDITETRVEEELREFGQSGREGNPYYHPSVVNAGARFRGGSVNILTDGVIPGFVTEGPGESGATPSASTMMPTDLTTGAQTAAVTATPEPDGGGFQVPEARIRKFFPETWLWDIVPIGRKGKAVFTALAPDTITTWMTSAFAVHPSSGLTVATKRAEIKTIRRLFVTLDLPSSAVRGEDVCITAQVVNHYTQPVQTWLMLKKNETAFKNTLISRKDFKNPDSTVEVRKSTYHTYYLGQLKPNSVDSRVFCFSPVALGDVPLHVLLFSTKPADGVERILRVVPEGVPRAQTYPVLLEVLEDSGFSHTVSISVPREVVRGSLRVTVTVTGNILGPVIGNLENLLKASYGCGEQNMLNFAPNVYVISYLRQTNQLTSKLLEKSRELLVSGYQRELRYRHRDGSFSAFGESHYSYYGGSNGSMWLTAFVLKCFAQASALGSSVISLDNRVITGAINWITRRQVRGEGIFTEPGMVFNARMQGGSAGGDVALTAYVLIALAETEKNLGDVLSAFTSQRLQHAIEEARFYLETDLISSMEDPYDACIVTYALTLTDSGEADQAISILLNKGISEDQTLHWERTPDPKTVRYSWYRKSDALSIEMTSYALMALILKNDFLSSLRVAKWLNAQRGPYGGFISTQDTVVGIQALTEAAAFLFSDNFPPMTVNIGWNSGGPQLATVRLDEESRLLLKSVEIPILVDNPPSQVTIHATTDTGASGNALAEVVVEYNVDTSTVEQVFGMTLTVSDNTASSFTLTTCVYRNTGLIDTMVEVDIGVPSGYWVDDVSSSYGTVSSRELKQNEQLVVLYYEVLTGYPECSTLMFTMTGGTIAHSQQTPVIVSDYYNPDDEVTAYYQIGDAGVCSVRPSYGLCQFAS